ncbi:MAG TPA: monofunctional biosynthetic peptidoglycan transglycosylase [Candidatus Kapabacteria bacterium]|jgi:monofunctional biosynthetic peptidoglycan transglycosylase|nr:monofunctional biosynthetic peptidoglycan transglycosylase [Candidatus Kapabacteria bacterium]HOV92466.1 monofunctional biosynthetic peptidoglycan transglycosylase [Candidatus Kapabacteria bacterium]
MIKKIFIIVLKVIFCLILFSIVLTAVYTVINPPVTPLMLIRSVEYITEGKSPRIDKHWRSYDKVSKKVYRAVISAEDARFMRHRGFDWKAIEAAQRYNERMQGKKVRGASTISQQTAKNTFLWPTRSWIRKGLEAYFTVLIEAVWGKQRILEVYVNVIEWGEGIYGVQAASQYYFNKDADELTTREAALLAAIIPNPRRWSASNPTPYIERRANWIMGRMNSVAIPKVSK